ncbi:MAG: four helix bundle protein [candidate division WOR-3 bacterium]|nr:MAG: four helix bundle protein [candidate division WOR-3 bacterium]
MSHTPSRSWRSGVWQRISSSGSIACPRGCPSLSCTASQGRCRAAVSIALNIAEGRAGDSDAEFRRFLGIGERSLVEVIACIRVCVTLKYVTETKTAELLATCDRLQAKLRTLRRRLGKGAKSA